MISRISEMPTGMKPIARPWSARPTSIGASESESAQITDADEQQRGAGDQHPLLAEQVGEPPGDRHRDRRASSVIVMTHARWRPRCAAARGSSLWIGMTSVCVSAAVRPPKQSTTTGSTG